MSITRLHVFITSVIFLTFFTQSVSANNPTYDQRREEYIDSSLNNTSGTKLILQAYRGLPLDTVELNSTLNSISTGETSDFDIIELIRILYLTNGTYDSKILPVLYSVPYWINYGDLIRNYWSENHMIMWMGSDWLLHEKYNKPVDNRLEARLRHYLQLKVQFGFYEFFSSVYGPYELSGLLNLADFAQDSQIKDLATKASQQLLKDFLLLTNDQGTYFPVAGRNYPSKYESAYNQNHNNLIYLMTGFGEAPNGASHGGPFLASSTIPMDTVLNSWKPFENYTFHNGHSLDTGFILNSAMESADKTIFQWSSGAYFHPDVVQETAQLLTDSNLWTQNDFAILAPLSSIPPQNMPSVANTLSSISKSSVLCEADITIFKNHSVTLSSVLDFWKGKVGFQQYTCVANVGTTAVYTASGEVKANWDNRNPNNQNVHLPYVEQHSNVSLIMYRPENVPTALGATYNYKEVALHFKDADFDEVQEDSLWLLGRQQESYVAVRRACIGEINTLRACPTIGGQTWVIMVGDSSMYGSFGNFQNVVHQSQFEEKWYLDTLSSQYVYYAKIMVDTTTIDYAWGVDSTTSTGFTDTEITTTEWNLFPNPANDMIQLNTTNPIGLGLVEIFNVTGQLVYSHNAGSNTLSISTLTFCEGSYILRLTQHSGEFTYKRVAITR
ncbi:MAG: T9SS type A sorting domain-containing protein [Chitinophagales bacterium]